MKKTTLRSDKPARLTKPQAQPETDSATIKLIRELSVTQAELANLVSDALMNGGDRYHVETIIRGALMHKWALMFTDHPKDFAERAQAQKTYAQIWTERRYRDLVRSWPEQTAPREEQPKSTVVIEMARANIRYRLRYIFEDFIGQADPESLFFLTAVLEDYNMNTNGHTGSPIPECFARQIDSDATWVKVPDNHVDRVNDFLALITGEKEDVAA
jgi:hypothetical protein